MIIVASLHALLVYVLHRARSAERLDEGEVERALLLVNVNERLRERAVDEPIPVIRRERRIQQSAETTSRSSSSVDESDAHARAQAQPRAPIDWRGNALRSAEIVARDNAGEKYRSFGPRKEGQRGEPETPSVFGNGPKHEYGAVGDDVTGDPVVWQSENCYTTLDKRVQTALDWVRGSPGTFASPAIWCVRAVGRREPDGTLFQHIRPHKEPPVPPLRNDDALPGKGIKPERVPILADH